MEFIRLDAITYRYTEEAARPAVDEVSLSIKQGEWVAIIGHNGSGKSTLAKLINGLLPVQRGHITIDGLELNPTNVWDIRRKIGMVFQNPDNQFVGATVRDDVVFGMENIGLSREEMERRLHESLERVGMQAFIDRAPARLSGGQKQRVAIASVMALSPEVIILDEATAMLDPRGRKEVLATLLSLRQEYPVTIISITHDLDEAARADRILVMQEGQLIEQGTPQQLFSRGQQLLSFGLDVPFVTTVQEALSERGIEAPKPYLTEKEMVDWLCQLLSKT